MRGATNFSCSILSKYFHFNPRSSCEERRDSGNTDGTRHNFNPRSSCEERHAAIIPLATIAINFNPRSSCEERPNVIRSQAKHSVFQSTLLMRGATSIILGQTVGRCEFQSTLLMRGATRLLDDSTQPCSISIHAPHARSDVLPYRVRDTTHNFNPRSSCEERPGVDAADGRRRHDFNPRSSCEERLACP